MKKVLYVFLFLLLVPISVNASSLSITCDKEEINANEEVSCNLSVQVDEGITYNKVDADINLTGAVDIKFNGSEGFTGEFNDNKLIVNNSSLVGSKDIGTLKIKFEEKGTIKLTNIKLYNNDENVGTISDVLKNINVTEKQVPAELETLTISDCDSCKLSPSFKKNITFYMVNTKSDKIRINATAINGSTVTGTGLKNLSSSSQTFEVKVTSSTGSVATYKIKVTKEASQDPTLKSLSINGENITPKFSSLITSYSAVINSDKIVINAAANDNSATVTGTGEKTLEYGENNFTIKVTLKDGSSKSYLIKVTRPDNRNANAYLKSLTINKEDIKFEKDITNYEYNITSNIDELEIEAIPEKEDSKVEITGNKDLKIGENIVTIKVTAVDGTEKVYTIKVTKDEIKVDNEVYLDDLIIKNYDIDFDSKKMEYIITTKGEKQLTIDAVTENYNVEILGNSDLKDGSIIKIVVSNEEESNIYKIKINVVEESLTEDADMNYIPIIMISLLGVLAVIDLVLLIKKVKNKNK